MTKKKEKNPPEVKYLTSISLAVHDVDDNVKHIQFTVIQELESKELRCFFDVVDPTKIKLKEPDEVS